MPLDDMGERWLPRSVSRLAAVLVQQPEVQRALVLRGEAKEPLNRTPSCHWFKLLFLFTKHKNGVLLCCNTFSQP